MPLLAQPPEPNIQRMHKWGKLSVSVIAILASVALALVAFDFHEAVVKPVYAAHTKVESLEGVSVFAFGGVGYVGRISQGETDFKVVLSEPAPFAMASFESLFASANPEGKAYALAGIRRLDYHRFRELREAVRSSNEKVTVMRGCVIAKESLFDVATEIDRGEFRF